MSEDTNLPAAVGTGRTLTAAELRDRVAKIRAAGQAPQKSMRGTTYLNLDGNTGHLTYGRQKTPVPAGQRFVAPFAMQAWGIQEWAARQKTNEKVVGILDGPRPPFPENAVMQGTLPKPRERDGWSEVDRVMLVGVDGGDLDGITLNLDCSNGSSRGASEEFFAALYDNAEGPLGAQELVNPIIELTVDSYENKEYNRDVYFPVFKIVEWTDGTNRVSVGDDEDPLG